MSAAENIAFVWGVFFKTIVLWVTSKVMKLKKQDILTPFTIAAVVFAISLVLGKILELIFPNLKAMILYFLIVIPILIVLDFFLIKFSYELKIKKTLWMTLIYWGLWVTVGSGLLVLITMLFNVTS